jgi:hypothetical protein
MYRSRGFRADQLKTPTFRSILYLDRDPIPTTRALVEDIVFTNDLLGIDRQLNSWLFILLRAFYEGDRHLVVSGMYDPVTGHNTTERLSDTDRGGRLVGLVAHSKIPRFSVQVQDRNVLGKENIRNLVIYADSGSGHLTGQVLIANPFRIFVTGEGSVSKETLVPEHLNQLSEVRLGSDKYILLKIVYARLGREIVRRAEVVQRLRQRHLRGGTTGTYVPDTSEPATPHEAVAKVRYIECHSEIVNEKEVFRGLAKPLQLPEMTSRGTLPLDHPFLLEYDELLKMRTILKIVIRMVDAAEVGVLSPRRFSMSSAIWNDGTIPQIKVTTKSVLA